MTLKIEAGVKKHPLEELFLIQEQVALESQLIGNFTRSLANFVPSLYNSIKGFFAGTNFVPSTQINIPSQSKHFLKFIRNQQYIHYSKLPLFVPVGFKGKLLDYTKVMEESTEFSVNIIEDVLVPFESFLSGLINSEDYRKETKNMLENLKKRENKRIRLNEELSQFFTKSSHDTVPVGQAIQRNADWEVVIPSSENLFQLYLKSDPVKVKAETNDVVALLKSLSLLAKDEKLTGMSGAQFKTLSEHTLLVAREVEFYSVTGFRLQNLQIAMRDSTKKLVEILSVTA